MRIDAYRNSGKRVSLRLTHTPTGYSVSGSGELEAPLRERLIRALVGKLVKRHLQCGSVCKWAPAVVLA